jgi:flagellar biosynthetic protein FlhB
MATQDPSRRTLPPTPQQRRRFREQGRVARSAVVGPGASLVALPVAVWLLWQARDTVAAMVEAGLGFRPLPAKDLIALAKPLLIGPVVVLFALVMVQGVVWFWPLRLAGLNPLAGFQRLFSRQALTQGLLLLVGTALIAAVAAWTALAVVPHASLAPVVGIDVGPASAVIPVLLAAAGVLGLLLAAMGGVTARLRYERDLRMTPEEFREDLKAGEGDPLVRRRWAELRRTFYATRLRAAMKRADVVVANPTHYAVALAYEPWHQDAPVVVAKGREERARRIRELAWEYQVPVVESPSLARDLYQSVREGDAIPTRLYRAVAEVLAYLHRVYGYRPREAPDRTREVRR